MDARSRSHHHHHHHRIHIHTIVAVGWLTDWLAASHTHVYVFYLILYARARSMKSKILTTNTVTRGARAGRIINFSLSWLADWRGVAWHFFFFPPLLLYGVFVYTKLLLCCVCVLLMSVLVCVCVCARPPRTHRLAARYVRAVRDRLRRRSSTMLMMMMVLRVSINLKKNTHIHMWRRRWNRKNFYVYRICNANGFVLHFLMRRAHEER